MLIYAIFGGFWDLAKNSANDFFLHSAKMCQKNSSKRWNSRFTRENAIFGVI
jgi:hypothetical protein